jgi:hypothetical protein
MGHDDIMPLFCPTGQVFFEKYEIYAKAVLRAARWRFLELR